MGPGRAATHTRFGARAAPAGRGGARARRAGDGGAARERGADQRAEDVDAEILLALARAREGAGPEAIAALNRALRSGRQGTRLVTLYQVLATTGALASRPAPARPQCLIAHFHRYLRVFDQSEARPAA